MAATQRKKIVIVCIVVPIALLHFVTGNNYTGPWPELVNGYLLDILVPLAFYFLVTLNPLSASRSWKTRAALVFGAASAVEIAQLFGAPIFGRTFDPVDFIMYGVGVSAAVLLDLNVFPRIFAFWKPEVVE